MARPYKHVRRASSATAIMAAVCVVMAVRAANGADKLAPIWKLKGHTLLIEALALSPDGRLALSGSRDQTVRLWDLESGKEVRRFEGHTTDVQTVAFSPDGKFIASGSGDRYARAESKLAERLLRPSVGGEYRKTNPSFRCSHP